jgi:hypothetical protein
MSKLVVRKMDCLEETDEIGSDDVYMAVFRGSFTLPPNVKVVGGKDTAWGDMSTGKSVLKDVVLEDTYQPENVYVAALIEQDVNRDLLVGSAWAKVMEFWANNWTKFAGNLGYETCAMTALLLFGLDNDEFLGVKRIPAISAAGGIGVPLEFSADGGTYKARIVKRA